jgi:hypothetical protein
MMSDGATAVMKCALRVLTQREGEGPEGIL